MAISLSLPILVRAKLICKPRFLEFTDSRSGSVLDGARCNLILQVIAWLRASFFFASSPLNFFYTIHDPIWIESVSSSSLVTRSLLSVVTPIAPVRDMKACPLDNLLYSLLRIFKYTRDWLMDKSVRSCESSMS